MEDKTRIELRSEKIKNIIGPIPKKMVWSGYAIIAFITLLVVIGGYVLYPYL